MIVTSDNFDKLGKSATESLPGGIYAYDSTSVLDEFADYVEADVNDMIVAISSVPLGEVARNAIEASMERIGYGVGRIAWVCLCGMREPSAMLEVQACRQLIEGIDPVVVIACDVGVMSRISEAYEVKLAADAQNRVACRSVAAFTDFVSMLESDDGKQRAWRVFKSLAYLA